MSRATIDFGIDLGTTNSAIAVLNGVTTEIIKNDLEQDITPSAIHFRKTGELLVGFRAKETLKSPRLDDTAIEFKRSMGSDFIYQFKSSGFKKKPEELSAEILKSLKGDVQRDKHELIGAAVITVPAAFELHQCDATKRAAQLAGFKQSALLQEPVAAGLAFGFQEDSRKALWLVFDFGGGTFDAAIIKAEDGTIHVVNNGGDNFLGGSNIDKALVTKLIAPRLVEEYGLEDFDWAHSERGMRWHQAFARLKWAAEQAKIELSRVDKDKATLDPDTVANLKDEETGEIVVENFEMELTRSDLVRVAEPFIVKAIDIAKGALRKKKLPSNAIERVILVGGPTKAPYFREMLADGLGIQLDHSVDPFTVVARGAAIFAGTQRINTGVVVAVPAGEFSVDLKYNPIGVDSAPTVGGRVSGASTKDFTGYAVELVDEKTKWRSGRIPLRPDGVFIANLHAERGVRNTYLLELYDPSGRQRKLSPNQIVYSIGGPPDEQSLIHSIGIALENNVYERFLEKGAAAQKKMILLRAARALRQGQSGEVLRIPVVEGENDLADRNSLIGTVEIKATNISRDLPENSEIEITLSVEKWPSIRVQAYCGFLGDDDVLDATLEYGKRDIRPERLSADCDLELQRLRQLKSKATGTGDETAKAAVSEAEQKLVERVKELEVAAKGDHVAALELEKRLLELKAKLDEAADALEWPALKAEVRQWIGYLEEAIEQCEATEDQKKKAGQLKKEVEDVIAQKKMDKLGKLRAMIESLYWDITSAQDAFWVTCFSNLEKDKDKIKDHARRDRLFDQGRKCIQNNNVNGLRSVVTQLWDLLPKPPTKEEKQGYGGDLKR